MVLLLNGPIWFRGIDTVFTLIFALVTLLIAYLSYKAYALTDERKYKYFSLSFLSLFLGFGIAGLFSGLLVTHVSTSLTNLLETFDIVFLAHVFFVTLAYTMLILVTYKVKERALMALLTVIALLFTAFSYQHFMKFHLVSLVLLSFLVYKFYKNFIEKKNFNSKLVFASFYLMATAELFLIVDLFADGLFYIVAQSLQLLGYLFLFYMFVRVLNNGGTKRKA